jgi:hypothetical protein
VRSLTPPLRFHGFRSPAAAVGIKEVEMGKTVLMVTLVVVVAVLALKFFFEIDAIELGKGFLSWLYDLLWGNRSYRRG